MDSSFLNYLGIFFLIAAGQGFFFVLSQISQFRKLNLPRILLSIIILIFSLSLVESGLWWSEKMDSFVHLIFISEPAAFLIGPLVYFYFRSSLTSIPSVKAHALHFLPFGIIFLYCSQFYFQPADLKNAMLAGELSFREFFFVYIPYMSLFTLKAISLLFYFYKIYQDFSGKILMREIKGWFLLTLAVFGLYVLSFIVFHVLSILNLITGCADYGIGISASLFIYLFAWFGWVRPRVFDGYALNESLNPLQKKMNGKISEEKLNDLMSRLIELMRVEKLYKSEDVRLETLSKRLEVPRYVLSQVVNSTGMNFFEFINHYRIEEAKRLLSGTSKEEFNIIEVAYEVGFANKVSFNRFFKRSTGLTPTEYRRQVGSEPANS